MKLKNKEIIYLLETAKTIYITCRYYRGMCSIISETYINIYHNNLDYKDIKYIIPKFNTEFLNTVCNCFGGHHMIVNLVFKHLINL